jgi:hypothetical protein
MHSYWLIVAGFFRGFIGVDVGGWIVVVFVVTEV